MFSCNLGCCKFYTTKYDPSNNHTIPKYKVYKGGVFCFDVKQNKVLLIQSRGKYWSVPKGSSVDGETIEDTAIRELYEESGLKINKKVLTKSYTISNRTYFYVEMEEQPIVIPKFDGNDSHSSAWIRLECLDSMIKKDYILINTDCKQLIQHFIK